MNSARFTYAPIESNFKSLNIPQKQQSYQVYQYNPRPPISSQSTAAKINVNPVV